MDYHTHVFNLNVLILKNINEMLINYIKKLKQKKSLLMIKCFSIIIILDFIIYKYFKIN